MFQMSQWWRTAAPSKLFHTPGLPQVREYSLGDCPKDNDNWALPGCALALGWDRSRCRGGAAAWGTLAALLRKFNQVFLLPDLGIMTKHARPVTGNVCLSEGASVTPIVMYLLPFWLDSLIPFCHPVSFLWGLLSHAFLPPSSLFLSEY